MNFMKKALFASLAVSATFSQQDNRRVIFKALDVPSNEKITLSVTDGKNNKHESILNYENGSKKMIDLEKSKDSGLFIKKPGVYLKEITIKGANNTTKVDATSLKSLNDSLTKSSKSEIGKGQAGFIIMLDKDKKKYDIFPAPSVNMLD